MRFIHHDIKSENVLCTIKQTPLHEMEWIVDGNITEDKEKENGMTLKLW